MWMGVVRISGWGAAGQACACETRCAAVKPTRPGNGTLGARRGAEATTAHTPRNSKQFHHAQFMRVVWGTRCKETAGGGEGG